MIKPSTRAKLEAVLAGLARGMNRTAACDAAGLSRQTFYRELEKPSFEAKVLQAEGQAIEYLVGCVMDQAPKYWQAAAWLLERLVPAYRLRTEVAVGGLDGGPLAMIVSQALAKTPDELDAEFRELVELNFPDELPGGEGGPDAGSSEA